MQYVLLRINRGSKGEYSFRIGKRWNERDLLSLPEKQPFPAQLDPGPQIYCTTHNGIPVRVPSCISHAIPVGVCEHEDGVQFDFAMESTMNSRYVLRSGILSISYCVYAPSDGTNKYELLSARGWSFRN